MDAPWAILVRAGVPDGAARSQQRSPEPASVREALAAILTREEAFGVRDGEPLLAWLRAFEQHWPTAFEQTLGDVGREALLVLGRMPVDPNRYLKLRRIAIANLAAAARQ